MVKLTDTIFRDAHQSLLATRMRTEDMLPIGPTIDKVGFFSFEVWGGATFDTCMRFLNEDPWERLKKMKATMPNTPMQMLERGQNIVAYSNFPDDIVQAFIHYAAKDGCDIFRIFDAVNDVRNMKCAIEAVKKERKHVQACISYTVSPVHTVEKFVEIAKRLEKMGADSFCVKDMAGLISPAAAYDLISKLKEAIKIPVNLHTHCTSGMAMMTYMWACDAGVDVLDTAMSPISWGTAAPPTEAVVAALKGTKYDTGYDMQILEECRKYFEKVWEKYSHLHARETLRIDPFVAVHQIPGGMYSNLVSQLKQQNALDKLDAVLKETPRVRADLGYPPLVTPTSQIVGTQAVFNVLTGGRYKNVIKEVKEYVRGMYGESPAPISNEIKEKVLGKDWESQIITGRPADLLKNRLNEIRQEAEDLGLVKKPEDVISYAIYPDVAKKFLKGEIKPEFTSDMLPLKPLGPTPAKPAQVALVAGYGKPRLLRVEVDGKAYEVKVAEMGARAVVTGYKPISPASGSTPTQKEDAKPKVATKAEEGAIVAPMQGTILRVKTKAGASVKKGDVIALLEAMKMENEILSPRDGVVKSINVSEGQTVQANTVIAVIG
jgi:pyruvate carboxylase subunit B